ncbi:hypothetical protein DFP73DRAFT_601134 [Morchella snyderi]|nr:hypothetical protein DFP73DRAFT_601134 [Morchella snyderi]
MAAVAFTVVAVLVVVALALEEQQAEATTTKTSRQMKRRIQRASQLAEALAKSANGKTVTKESGPNEKLVGGVRDSIHTQLSESVRLRGRDSDEG